MPTHSVTSGELYFYEQGSGPTTLFLHGGPLDHRVFARQLAEIPLTRRCIAPDLRGFGRSSGSVGRGIDLRAHAGDLASLLAQLVGERAHVLGLSLGGHVALALAAEYPERIRSLALVSTSVMGTHPDRRLDFETLSEELLRGGRRRLGALLADRMLVDSETSLSRCQLMTMVEGTPYETIHEVYRWIATREDETEALRKIDLPTLIVAGDRDPAVSAATVEAMASALPRGRGARIAEAGHLLPMEKPSELNSVVIDFWESLDRV